TRIKRFFREFKIDFSSVSVWVIHCFGLSGQALYLSMDRTNWRWGKKDINILMLSVVYKGIAIPLFWTLLAKGGNSDTRERIEIVQRFITKFGKSMIAGLLADREFVGDNWFAW
ncbi:IS4 family transposase, partial [Legionella pneumophila]